MHKVSANGLFTTYSALEPHTVGDPAVTTPDSSYDCSCTVYTAAVRYDTCGCPARPYFTYLCISAT